MYQNLKALSNKELKNELKQYTIFIYKNNEWIYNQNTNKDYLNKLESEFYVRSIK